MTADAQPQNIRHKSSYGEYTILSLVHCVTANDSRILKEFYIQVWFTIV